MIIIESGLRFAFNVPSIKKVQGMKKGQEMLNIKFPFFSICVPSELLNKGIHYNLNSFQDNEEWKIKNAVKISGHEKEIEKKAFEKHEKEIARLRKELNEKHEKIINLSSELSETKRTLKSMIKVSEED